MGLFVCMPSSEQKSALRSGALLLDIGQIDGVSFHQKLDGRRNDQERRNVDREYLKGLHGSSSAISVRTLPHFMAQWGQAQTDAGFSQGVISVGLTGTDDFRSTPKADIDSVGADA